jgi:hypothetical protein
MSDAMRQQYRPLSDVEKLRLSEFKALAAELYDVIGTFPGDQRSFALAKTKVEEAVMWATKGLTL